jgi:hypothetical protein
MESRSLLRNVSGLRMEIGFAMGKTYMDVLPTAGAMALKRIVGA